MNKDIIEKMREIELEALDIVIDLCEKNALNYYLIGGTLLGAVRHKGFIPWDDDIDIAMPRNDYDSFIKIWKEQYDVKSGWILQNKDTDKRVSFSFTKLRKLDTEIVEKENRNAKYFRGIYFDIFPLDNIIEKDTIFLRVRCRILKYFAIISLYKSGYRDFKKGIVRVLLNIFLFPLSLIPYSFLNYMSNRIMRKYNKKETEFYTSYASGYGYLKQKMPKSVYGGGAKVYFEGRMCSGPADYKFVLKKIFGNDYIELPPLEKRKSNHRIYHIKIDDIEVFENYERD